MEKNTLPRKAECRLKASQVNQHGTAGKTLFEFELQGKVKESDLSASGFVEHVRIAEWLHESRVQYLKDKKAGVYEIALAAGLVPAVSNLTIDLPAFLRRDEGYTIAVNLTREGARYVFKSEIRRDADNEICVKSVADLVFTRDGRPIRDNVLAV